MRSPVNKLDKVHYVHVPLDSLVYVAATSKNADVIAIIEVIYRVHGIIEEVTTKVTSESILEKLITILTLLDGTAFLVAYCRDD